MYPSLVPLLNCSFASSSSSLHAQVASTIIGATSLPQLKENLDAWGPHSDLPESAIKGVEEVFAKYRDPAKA